jgi:hypothetical protein
MRRPSSLLRKMNLMLRIKRFQPMHLLPKTREKPKLLPRANKKPKQPKPKKKMKQKLLSLRKLRMKKLLKKRPLSKNKPIWFQPNNLTIQKSKILINS